MLSRLGGVLLVLALVAGAIVGASQEHWGLGDGLSRDLLVLALVGAGTLLIAADGRAPFDLRSLRAGLVLVGVGALSIVGAAIRGGMVFYAMSDLPAVTLFLGGILALVAGLALVAAVFARHPDWTRLIALLLLAGIAAVFPGTTLIDAGLAFVGFALVVIGLASIGFIALDVRRVAS